MLCERMTDANSELPLQDVLENFSDTELVFGLVGAVGAKLDAVQLLLANQLIACGYEPVSIVISEQIIPKFVNTDDVPKKRGYERTSLLMTKGNEARQNANDNSILALGVAAAIYLEREVDEIDSRQPKRRTAYIVRSLKRPEEVKRLRGIYGQAFFLIATHVEYSERIEHLKRYYGDNEEEAKNLIERDSDESNPYGQKVTETFQMADFFIRMDTDKILDNEINRILQIIFGEPFTTPTFDEYAMFFAFSASLRSADLSRQVGAVISRKNQVIAHGANECPQYGGGLYWATKGPDGEIINDPNGRDFKRKYPQNGTFHLGYDSNVMEQYSIQNKIIELGKEKGLDESKLREVLKSSPIADLTEFGRVVHAEMEALLSCARTCVSTQDAELYCTTFPCHNCAKHIVAAGIRRVIYIEPYPKSKAAEFHDDSIYMGFAKPAVEGKVHFEPYVGVGPRRFFDLFSYKHGTGKVLKRKNDGLAQVWDKKIAIARMQQLPLSYIDLEELAHDEVNQFFQPKEDTQ